MLVRIELNVALARINPLFYRKVRQFVHDTVVRNFFIPDSLDGKPTGRMKQEDAE